MTTILFGRDLSLSGHKAPALHNQTIRAGKISQWGFWIGTGAVATALLHRPRTQCVLGSDPNGLPRVWKQMRNGQNEAHFDW